MVDFFLVVRRVRRPLFLEPICKFIMYLLVTCHPISGFFDGRLRCPGGDQDLDEAVRPDQQHVLVQHDDDGIAQPQDRLSLGPGLLRPESITAFLCLRL